MTNLPAVQQNNRETFERIIYKMVEDENHHFLSCVLQSMNTYFVNYIPTAGVAFDQKLKLFKLMVNPKFFQETLKDDKERIAVIIHEVYHILHKHVFIPPEKLENLNKPQLNIAMDLVINQLITNLPEMCFFVENMRDVAGKPFPANLTYEEYYDLLEDAEVKVPKDCSAAQPKDDKDENGEPIPGTGKPYPSAGNGKVWVPMKEYTKTVKEFDMHDWSDADVKERLDATRDLIKRSMQKNSFSHSKVPDFVQDCLEKVEASLKKLNYKEMLLKALRNSLPSKDTMKTWKRPSRRYGDACKGNMANKMPKLEVYIDTSGSISHEEANEFLKITNNFMLTGVSKANVNMFHTALYYRESVKKNFKIEETCFQSGGTCLEPVIGDIYKKKPDLAIIITDGYYSDVQLKKGMTNAVVFVISKGGTTEHPLKRLGTTVKY